jgi:hypothetical protein
MFSNTGFSQWAKSSLPISSALLVLSNWWPAPINYTRYTGNLIWLSPSLEGFYHTKDSEIASSST